MEKTSEQIQQEKEKRPKPKQELESLIRIHGTDIFGNKGVYIGLTKIKGVSFSISNALCKLLGIEKNKKIGSLSKEEIESISSEIKNPKIPGFLMNRRKDLDTGEDKHLSISDLDLRKEFDIKRLKKIRSYKGLRHARGLPVRGQRTRSHFRKKGKNKAIGVKTKRTGKKG